MKTTTIGQRLAIGALVMLPKLSNADDSASLELGRALDVAAGTALHIPSPRPPSSLRGVGSLGELSGKRIAETFAGLQTDRATGRGITEMRLYAASSAGVVLVATEDMLGSGSLLTSDGLVVTNLHVVGSNNNAAVFFKPTVEGAHITKADMHLATVVRRDQLTDLALLRVSDSPSGTTAIPLGSMAEIAVGSDVNAIGHPTGEAWSYTKGIVSQIRTNYQWKAEDGFVHTATVIQTQTPINPGNSGGPLLTNDGKLIGINSFKSEGEGLNFAVSVDDVRKLLEEKQDRIVQTASTHRPQGSCTPKSYGKSAMTDPPGTKEVFDYDCSGKPDAVLLVPSKQSEPIHLLLDVNHTGHVSVEYIDVNRNGHWSVSYWDTKGTGKADLKCYHTDGNVKPSRCEKYTGN